jgi:hypothetical protein
MNTTNASRPHPHHRITRSPPGFSTYCALARVPCTPTLRIWSQKGPFAAANELQYALDLHSVTSFFTWKLLSAQALFAFYINDRG